MKYLRMTSAPWGLSALLRTVLAGMAMAGIAVALAVVSSFSTVRAQAQDRPVLVFAAASLKNALDAAAHAWMRETGRKVVVSYAASNALAKQIEAGAPADIMMSADLDWMDYLQSRNLIRADTRSNLLGNTLVLVAQRASTVAVLLAPGLDLRAVLGNGRLAMGNVDAVPAGRYGRAALESLGAWQGVKDGVAQAESVRAALLLVSRGEAPLGIVYRTDAASDPGVRVVAEFPKESYPPIVYPVAVTSASAHPEAGTFLAYLRSSRAARFFEEQGFSMTRIPASGS